jgi:rhodanese-related sulfurtransferase
MIAPMGNGAVRGVDELVAAARERIERLEPADAWAAAKTGEALLVDIRSQEDRRRDGVVPGALHIPRTVLEWRVDSKSEWRNPHVGGRERRLVLLCSHGFSSSLAAASLVELGFSRAGDVVGGFEAWRREGLPVVPAAEPAEGALPGMGLPDRHDVR